jgi:predicted secreted protein
MKRILFCSLLGITVFLSSCETLKKVASLITPSEFEMATGLRDALTQGLFKSFDAFADPNGNPLVRFAFPGDAAKIEKTLRDLGLDKLIDNVTSKYTHAMSSAVSAAKPIFINSVKSMSIKDAAKILVTDNPHAATEYFKTSMSPELMVAFRPIVDSTVKTEGAATEWANLVSVYNKIPFISKPLESNLTDFISARVIDGMFVIVGNEEENIRTKYEFRKTDMMKKVFGYAEEELKRRASQQLSK